MEEQRETEMAAPQNTFIATPQMFFWKILMGSSDLPSLKHCIFHLISPRHGSDLFCQHWTTRQPFLDQDLTKNAVANWLKMWSAN